MLRTAVPWGGCTTTGRKAPMTINRSLLAFLLQLLGVVFFVWACLKSAGVPGGAWLVPGGLAAWLLSVLLG